MGGQKGPDQFRCALPPGQNDELKGQEVLEQQPAGVGKNALRVKLYSLYRKMPVTKTHDYPRSVSFTGLSADLQFLRQLFLRHDQRMVAGCGHGMGRVAKDSLAVMFDLADLAVHDLSRPDNLAAEGRANGLVSQANAHNRLFPCKVP